MSTETEKFKQLETLYELETNLKTRQEITKEQIKILKLVQQQFIEQVEKNGHSLDSYNVLEIFMNQYKGMKQLAEREGLETYEYDNKIEEIKYKIFGKKV